MKITIKIIVLCSLSLAIAEAAAQKRPISKPNVIVILADDMGYGDISANNPSARTKTPNIDKMAQKSVVFTDAHSGGAVCIPSRYGLLTGRYYFRLPERKDFLGYLPPLIEPGRETIGSLMQKAGYTTAAIGKWHLGLNWQLKDKSKPQISLQSDKTVTNTDFSKDVSGGPNSLGFNYSYILPASLDMPPYVFVKNNRVVDPNVILTADAYKRTLPGTEFVWDRKHTTQDDVYWERGVWWRNGEMSKTFDMENSMDSLVDKGLSFIEEQTIGNPEKPFMLYLALTGPHTPWLANKEFKGKSSIGAYGDFVAQVDSYVAQVNARLKELKIDDNTIVIFTSDNGAPWGEEDIQAYSHRSNYPKRGQKGDIYEGGHHIPLIVQWPGEIKEKFEYTQTVSLVDFMATFSELTGQAIKEKNGEDSFSFYDVIKNRSRTPVRDQVIYISSRNLHAIKTDEWKYIDGLGSGGFTEPGRIKPVNGGPLGQLYNLKSDPLEQNNLYMEYPPKVKELKALLDKLKTQGYSKVVNR
ncbi:MAG: sulfatase-like hydrolase/transferase [Daejeonella sp.]